MKQKINFGTRKKPSFAITKIDIICHRIDFQTTFNVA